jgi:peptide chain release factor subunit 1
VIGQDVVDRLLRFRSTDALVLSVYVSVPADPGQLRGVDARFHSLLDPLHELADSRELSHTQRESLRADIARALEVAPRARTAEGRAIAIFASHQAGLYEEVVLPRAVRDRAVVDATPYVRPLLAVLDEDHRACVVVVDREHAWVYEFHGGELEEVDRVPGRAFRKPNFAGWYGLEEHRVRNRAKEQSHRHFRKTAAVVDEVVRRTNPELLVVGGHQETVAAFLRYLTHDLQARLAGTFVIDPSTLSAAAVREHAQQVVSAYERNEETRLVATALERVAAHGFAAAGLEWCLLAVDEQAVQLLLVNDDEQAPGRACSNCGWLGLEGEECPVCAHPTSKVPDVIDEMAAAVIDAGGRVEHVYADTELSRHVVAALLRFPVPQPDST